MVGIPSGMAMNVSFEDFYIEDYSTCEYVIYSNMKAINLFAVG